MIELKDIHKSFQDNYVLRGVSLHVAKGESLVVIGGSGSGKSVLLKHIIGLLQPDRGTVVVKEKDISQLGEERLNEHQFVGCIEIDATLDNLLSAIAYKEKGPDVTAASNAYVGVI